jgi:hypothetical protein
LAEEHLINDIKLMNQREVQYIKLLCLISLLLLPGNIYPQKILREFSEQSLWLNLGVGTISSMTSGGISASIRTGSNLFTLRYVGGSQRSTHPFMGGTITPESISDLGLLYGLIKKGRFGYASISGGISRASGVQREKYLGSTSGVANYEEVSFSNAGFPIEGQLFFTPFSFLGIGLTGLADFNTQRSFGGVLFCLQFGALR